MTMVKILFLVFGVILVVAGSGMIVAGGGMLWANSALTDDEGYITSKTFQIETDSYAITSRPVNIDVASMWGWGNLATFKIEGSSNDPSKSIFIGIADQRDAVNHLNDVDYDEVNFRIHPDKVEYRNHAGNSEPAPPTTRTFWMASVHGDGMQTLQWELEEGTWSLVLMNDDASAGIDVDVIVGAKIPHMFRAGLIFLIGGIVTLLLGVFMILLAVRRTRERETGR